MTGLTDLASLLGSRIATNLSGSFASLTIHQWLRLIVIAGAYLLFRPYLVKLGASFQMKQHEAEEKASLAQAAAIAAGEAPALSPNDLRNGLRSTGAGTSKAVPHHQQLTARDVDDSSDDDTAAPASGTDWGKNARRRQRRMLRKMLEAHEQQLADAQADEEDKDIQEFLVDA